MDSDYALAVALQEQINEEEKRIIDVDQGPSNHPDVSIVDNYWELADPNPNIHELFLQFDAFYFKSALNNAGVEVRWSPRMTLCAGVCSYEGRGGLCSVRLSRPLLKYRSRRDLVQTLLHEMIHAYLFVAERNTDHDAHGPQFLYHMERINKLSGAKITVYHSFHDEVEEQRQHWWKCDGPCQHRSPFYGVVKRAMNRPPSSKDYWWSKHEKDCGGKYIKIKEPEGFQKKGKNGKEKKSDTEVGKSGNIKELLEKSITSSSSQLPTNSSQSPTKTSSPSPTKTSSQLVTQVTTDFSGKGHVLGGKGDSASGRFSSPSEAAAFAAQKRYSQMNESLPSKKMKGSMNRDKSNKTKHDKNYNTSSLNHNNFTLCKNQATHRTTILFDEVPHSSHTTPGQNVQLVDLTDRKETIQQKKTSRISVDDDNDALCGSSSQEQNGELVDLTASKLSCPVCGFSGLREELLEVHIDLCLKECCS